MGDPKKQRKTFSTPSHPWNKDRIVEENELAKDYGLGNKKEIYKANSILKGYLKLAKRFATVKTEQDKLEKSHFLAKLKSFGFTDEDDISKALDITLKDILERRLQTILHRSGRARSMKQARQFITHRHIIIGKKKITMPSYMVTLDHEKQISFVENSNLAKDDHPERVIIVKKEKKAPPKGRGRFDFKKMGGRAPPRPRSPRK
ncbi:MAG: 30S ribosomal protein S4 [Nanoarchaeota archaeon]|nr:30S ribosomal protein S4 [Nanoarchaeota archaeon]